MDFDLTIADTAFLIEDCLYTNAARYGYDLDRNILRAGIGMTATRLPYCGCISIFVTCITSFSVPFPVFSRFPAVPRGISTWTPYISTQLNSPGIP
jgi:hypothetical protein